MFKLRTSKHNNRIKLYEWHEKQVPGGTLRMDDGDARRKFCIKPLKEINHGVVQVFF